MVLHTAKSSDKKNAEQQCILTQYYITTNTTSKTKNKGRLATVESEMTKRVGHESLIPY